MGNPRKSKNKGERAWRHEGCHVTSEKKGGGEEQKYEPKMREKAVESENLECQLNLRREKADEDEWNREEPAKAEEFED